ncbi:FkbM family methyltransferase [Rhodoblastus acidophilus]|uniref:FkbM family methyltransferase n=1 Tax=Rhodoblastus acidophilus TaxID=1074 RepID=UPI0022256DEA|nr:FkbM family methyltransferase [Rhodoblastus acidophilus]MCW2282996.1 FkbM family methyltransferase [Rhodoblastus acidophilus]MCW2331953.1 FkbM family methyltransferase [Rhodoblastus acidophilus]
MSNPATSFADMQAARTDYGPQFELLVAVLYNQIVKPGDTVVDGGANSGLHAVPLAKLAGPDGLLIAFEPIPEVFEGLQKNTAGRSVELRRLALSDVAGQAKFLVDENNLAMSHITHPYDKVGERQRFITVDCVTLDQVIGPRKISFIKLDLEGNDFLAIRGGKQLILRDRPPIIFENGRDWTAQCRGYTSEDYFNFFDEVSYDVYDLHGRSLNRDTWKDKNIAFEFIAVPRETPERNLFLLKVIEFFWREHASRPTFAQWKDCVLAVWDAAPFMASHHGPNWLAAAYLTPKAAE